MVGNPEDRFFTPRPIYYYSPTLNKSAVLDLPCPSIIQSLLNALQMEA